jgi:outer membrane protein OmpA-like peptidoglycan-associated protein
VVKALKDDPHITQIRIEGHTDDRGSPTGNNALSQRRAQAVAVYLISKGISARRLSARGYGQAQPLVPNDSAEHREQNRRVEFVILEVDGVAVESATPDATR